MGNSLSIENLRENYSFSRKEFGKVLFIASLSLLITSVHVTLTFDTVEKDLQQLNRGFDQVRGIINSDSFNNSLEALNSLSTTEVGPRFSTASQAFTRADNNLEKAKEAEDRMEDARDTYQWLVLVSMLGAVVGISAIYI